MPIALSGQNMHLVKDWHFSLASLVAQLVKNLPAVWETCVRSLDWGDPLGERKGYPLQYSGLENFMDYIVHEVTKRWTRLSDCHFRFTSVHRKVGYL